ncbi:hypothetical protein ES702_06230 [subsurface metagenome]
MRTRAEILGDALETRAKTPDWDVTAAIHERLTIEVLVDIRDGLNIIGETVLTYLQDAQIAKDFPDNHD